MSDPLSGDDESRSTDEVKDDLTKAFSAQLRQNPELVPQLARADTRRLAERLTRKKKRKKKTPAITGWDTPPYVDPGAEEDLAPMASDTYEGMDEATARGVFARHGLDFDALTPAELAERIVAMRADLDLSESLGSACFAFCEAKIPAAHRKAWVIAIMAARDTHEDD